MYRTFRSSGSTMRSTLARVSVTSRCFGPVWSAVMYGMFTCACCTRVSSTRAAVAASKRLPRRDTQILFLFDSGGQGMRRHRHLSAGSLGQGVAPPCTLFFCFFVSVVSIANLGMGLRLGPNAKISRKPPANDSFFEWLAGCDYQRVRVSISITVPRIPVKTTAWVSITMIRRVYIAVRSDNTRKNEI